MGVHLASSAAMTPQARHLTLRGAAALVVALSAVSCAGASARDAGPAVDADTPPDGNARLDVRVQPLRYRLDLQVDPGSATFEGTAEIDLVLGEPRRRIVLHAKDMIRLDAHAVVGGQRIAGRVVEGTHGAVALVFDRPLPQGGATLHLAYEAPLTEVPEGIYRVAVGERWYVYTQFEPLEARGAFPCFDEPGFKVPFRLTLRVPVGMTAFSNTPERARTSADGWTAFHFEDTYPLPSYLIAWAIGDLEVATAPVGAVPGVPMRVVTTRGKGHLAAWILEVTPRILGALTDYFGAPYPYAKLDLVAVPNFGAGAMENVGLVTFRERLILGNAQEMTPSDRRSGQGVMAHELAHMWFGDLVTMPWWDDLWLNEAFATWMTTRVLTRVDPPLEAQLTAVERTGRVMRLDAKRHARAIRQSIAHGGDVYNAFDGITYTKGAAVIRMLEAWMGEAPFREGLRAYMARHGHGVGTTRDMVRALEGVTALPVQEVLASFADQPGVPLVTAEVQCARGTRPILGLRQESYRLLGHGDEADRRGPWKIPVCVRYAASGRVRRLCVLLGEAPMAVELEGGCPIWLHPNHDEKGYFHWRSAPKRLVGLASTHRGGLTLPERVGLTGHFRALLDGGLLEMRPYLDALRGLCRDNHPAVIQSAVAGWSSLDRLARQGTEYAAYSRLLRKVLGRHLRRLGPAAKDGEPPRKTMLRQTLIRVLADGGRDATLRAGAREGADAFLADPTAARPDGLDSMLTIAAWDGDAPLWEALRSALSSAVTPQVRVGVIRAMGSFEDAALLTRSLDLLLDGTLLAQDVRTMLGSVGRRDATLRTAWDWIVAHYEPLHGRMGPRFPMRLAAFGGAFCSPEDRAMLATFFAQPEHAPDGTARPLALALERIDTCLARRATLSAPLEAYLSRR